MPILVNCECGKQFQAKDENAGRRFLCNQCGRELTVPKLEAEPIARTYVDTAVISDEPNGTKTSGKAIASLILSVFAIFPCVFITGLPAFILGVIGLSDINRSSGRVKGNGLAIAGLTIGAIGCLILGPLYLSLFVPAVQAARAAAQRAVCTSHMKEIGVGFHNYSLKEGHLPASSINDAQGNPLLSWRVAILPYVGQEDLYKQFKLNEPWDSPTNLALVAQIPAVYRCLSDLVDSSGTTRYQAIVGDGTIFEGGMSRTIGEITDGPGNTLIVVEAKTPVPWTKPADIDITQVGSAVGSPHPRVYNGLFADGVGKPLSVQNSPAILRAFATRAGGEVLSTNDVP